MKLATVVKIHAMTRAALVSLLAVIALATNGLRGEVVYAHGGKVRHLVEVAHGITAS